MSLRLNDWFAGAGGATQGACAVPGIEPVLAANHDRLAIDTHSTNFPKVEHFLGDIKNLDVATHPYAEIHWASPECTAWSQGRGKPVDFDKPPSLFEDDPEPAEGVQRSRALMQDVIRYLEGMQLRQQPVLAGVVENVVDIRKWVLWDVWLQRILRLGYRTRLIALNSMHAQPRVAPRAPQSHDRLYLAYWHRSLGRDPDWDRWLRPSAYCPSCDQVVAAVQWWKRPGQDMGRYKQTYLYRCPGVACRGQVVEPGTCPRLRRSTGRCPGSGSGTGGSRWRRRRGRGSPPASPATGGRSRWRRPATRSSAARVCGPGPVEQVLTTLHTTASKALAVPVDGRPGKSARPAGEPMMTHTTRLETALATPFVMTNNHSNRGRSVTEAMPTLTTGNTQGLVQPFVAELRGGGSTARPVGQALATVTAAGNHHGLVVPAGGTWNTAATDRGEPLRALTTRDAYALVSPYYGTSDTAKPAGAALGALTTRDRFALVMRNNTARGDQGQMSTPAAEPLRTLTTAGHQSLLQPATSSWRSCWSTTACSGCSSRTRSTPAWRSCPPTWCSATSARRSTNSATRSPRRSRRC